MSRTGRPGHRAAQSIEQYSVLNDPVLLDQLVEALFQEDIRTYQENYRAHERSRRMMDHTPA